MKALLVIDMLEDFFESGLLAKIRSELVQSIDDLIARARLQGLPVIWVRQEFRDDLEDAFLAMRDRNVKITIAGTPGALLLSELEMESEDHEIIKKRFSAFHGTDLDHLLGRLGVDELILSGVNTHACIRTTAIDAYQRDIRVWIPRECVASNDSEHHDVTLRYLSREIATVSDLDTTLRGTGA